MVIMVVNGGFANQIYRYACAYATAKKYGQELIVIAQTTDAATDPFQLGEFKIEYSRLYITKSYLEVFELLAKWREKISIADVTESQYLDKVNEQLFKDYDGVVLWGGFQSPIFFQQYIEDLRRQFVFMNPSEFIKVFSSNIERQESVAVHVRRGDFLTYEGLCSSMDYYKAAMVYLEDAIGYGIPQYYIFSDDREFVKDFFGNNERIHFVANYGDYKEATEEFIAMSMCKHRILTEESSFSRMADALNDCVEGYAVYAMKGMEACVSPREKLTFLQTDYIVELAKYYAPLFGNNSKNDVINRKIDTMNLEDIAQTCIDAWNVSSVDELKIRIRQIQILNEKYMYAEAISPLRKLWEISVGTQYENEVHSLYWKAMYEFGYRSESLIEALHVENIKRNISSLYSPFEQKIFNKLLNTERKEFVIIPSRSFEPHIFEDLTHIGALLRRIGNNVTYMFREQGKDMEYSAPYNKTLRENNFYIDVMGHNTWCNIINLTEQESRYKSLKDYYKAYLAGRCDVVFICKKAEDIEALKEVRECGKIQIVYMDYTNVLDAGNYIDVSVTNVKMQNIITEEQSFCYTNCDKIISYNRNIESNEKVISFKMNSREYNEPSEKKQVADYYRIDPNMVENVLLFASEI